MSIPQARKYVKSMVELSVEEKNHLNTLLDRGMIVPMAVFGGDAESLREVAFRNPLTVADLGSFPSPLNSISATSSALSTLTDLAHIALPYGPTCFWSPRALITQLLRDVEAADGTDVLFTSRHINLPMSFHNKTTIPLSGEEEEEHNNSHCHATLNCICDAIIKAAPLQTRLSVVLAKQMSTMIDFSCASSQTTSPEPVICYSWSGNSVGLIASEAQSVDASAYACMGQAVQMAADCALNLLPHLDGAEDVVVPYVTLAGFGVVQFGAVYLMEHSYPCSVTLSEDLSVLNGSHLQRINQWIRALSLFCQRMVELLEGKTPTSPRNRLLVGIHHIHKDFILKPVVVSLQEPQFAASLAAYLLRIFYRLWHSDARPYVQFPVGVMAYPNDALLAMAPFAAFIRQKLRDIAARGGKRASYYDDIVQQPGHPMLVYEDLCCMQQPQGGVFFSAWRRGDSLHRVVGKDDDGQLIEKFLAALATAVRAIGAAGVVHMDLRLSNVFYRVAWPHDDDGGANAEQEGLVEIRIIDWDDSLLAGETVDARLFASMQRDANHYPHGEEFKVATGEYHRVFLELIGERLRNPDENNGSQELHNIPGRKRKNEDEEDKQLNI